MTVNSGDSGWLTPSAVTWPSSIACRKADWLRVGARLISSASSRSVKIGPGTNSKRPSPGWYTLPPSTSAGNRSDVNCTRLNSTPSARARPLASVVLPTPGTSSSSTCPPASAVISNSSSTAPSPSHTAANCARAAASVAAAAGASVSIATGRTLAMGEPRSMRGVPDYRPPVRLIDRVDRPGRVQARQEPILTRRKPAPRRRPHHAAHARTARHKTHRRSSRWPSAGLATSASM